MAERDHFTVHAVHAEALFVHEVESAEQVGESGVPRMAMSQNRVGRDAAGEATRADDLHGGVGLHPRDRHRIGEHPVAVYETVDDRFANRAAGQPPNRGFGEAGAEGDLGVDRTEPFLYGRELFEDAQADQISWGEKNVTALNVDHGQRYVGTVGRAEQQRPGLGETVVRSEHAEPSEKIWNGVGGVVRTEAERWVLKGRTRRSGGCGDGLKAVEGWSAVGPATA